MCGKNVQLRTVRKHTLGSPPHVREKLLQRTSNGSIDRITPACAGKTRLILRQTVAMWDHPRVCGKNYEHGIDEHLWVGSPPRVREKRGLRGGDILLFGITPACAGKT